MKPTPDLPLDADELIQSLKDAHAYATGDKTRASRVRRVRIPEPVESIPPTTIRAIRLDMAVSQEEFAGLLNVPTITARSWETGKRNPSGAALRLLQIARNNPAALISAAQG